MEGSHVTQLQDLRQVGLGIVEHVDTLDLNGIQGAPPKQVRLGSQQRLADMLEAGSARQVVGEHSKACLIVVGSYTVDGGIASRRDEGVV